MPFQQRIDSTSWPLYCISYNELKRSVYEILRSDSVSVFPEKELQDLLQVELDKVNLFAVIKYEDIFRSLQSVANASRVPERISSDPIRTKQYFSELERSIEQVGTEIVNLEKYVRTNCEGFIRLISKFDKILKSNGTSWFIARLGKEEFCNVNFQSLFILLSLTWSKYRSAVSGASAASAGATWKAPESFVRSTAKYWVRPEHVARLKADVLKQLPYLIFGASVKDQEQFLDPTSLFEASSSSSGAMSETQLVTSIYFDNEQRDIYKQRILRKEGARLVRLRWYGPNEGSPDQDIFVERKIHHESWFDESSSKDRFSVKQKDVFSFMKGDYDIGGHFDKMLTEAEKVKKSIKPIIAMKELAFEVDTMIRDLSLQPFIRTCYHRCAFQLATSNDVRISLDSQMTLINEFRPNHHPSPPWCRVASDVLAESDLVRFPYAILEVKLADARNTPAWVNAMLLSCGAIRVHKFSKFLHAMAFLHPQRTNVLPHWFPEFQSSTNRQLPVASPVSGVATREQRIENILISQSTEEEDVAVRDEEETGQAATVPVKDMKALEPKSVFANERTFLHYCQKGMFLLTVGVSLGLPTELGVGAHATRAAVAAVVIAYLVMVFAEFQTRQKKLLSITAVTKQRERLDITSGPVLAAVMISLGAAISFINSSNRIPT